MKKPHWILTLLLVGNLFFSFGQKQNPVVWKYSVEQKSDKEAVLLFEARIEEGWHLYSQYQNGMALPLVFTITPNTHYSPIGKINVLEEPKYTEKYDAEFDDTERFFLQKALFKYKIRLHDDQPFSIQTSIEGQACQEGRCVPIKAQHTFHIGTTAVVKEEVPATAADTTPVIATEPLQLTDSAAVSSSVSIEDTPLISSEDPVEEESLFLFFIFAFLGGLVGILTPCVFPMIPMTVSFFLKNEGRKQALFYGFSIIFIYVVIGIVLSAIFGQGFANFISTHWLPNLLFAGVFILFAISLFGYFELTLPSGLVDKSVSNESRSGYIGTFFMALTLVLVSFSCTLPIAGTVALSAAGGSFVKPIIGMLGFSLAFALPFTLFAFFPKLLKNLPKAGGWMNTVKVCLAFVELAFALKFINVPDQTYHWGILDREIYLALWIVLFAMLGFYLLGKIKFPLDSDYPVQSSWFRLFLAIGSFGFVVYMIPGMFGAPLNGLSGWLPPMKTQDFNIKEIVYDASHADQVSSSLCEAPLFGDQLHFPTGLNGYFDYDQALACAKEQNKPVFLDFTGHGCVNCRKVEQKVLSNPGIQALLNKEFILCALFVDDKVISLPLALQIKDKKGQLIKMLGQKNAYIQNTLFDQNSQPCYIVVNPDGSVIGGPLFFETDVAKFESFLRQVLSNR